MEYNEIKAKVDSRGDAMTRAVEVEVSRRIEIPHDRNIDPKVLRNMEQDLAARIEACIADWLNRGDTSHQPATAFGEADRKLDLGESGQTFKSSRAQRNVEL